MECLQFRLNLHAIRASAALRWIDRRGAPLAALFLLIAFGMIAHYAAIIRIGVDGGPAMAMGSAAAMRFKFIGYINTYPFIIVPYLALYVGSVLWLQFRNAPHWSLRLAFVAMALPVLGYMWICLRVIAAAIISR